VVDIYNGVLTSHENEWPISCDNIDGIEDHYFKWSKSGTERQMPHDLIHMWILKLVP
jgi:hypothetical protein